MRNPTWKDFIYRVGGAAAIYLIAILFFNKYAPSYVGVAVLFVTILIFVFAAFSEKKAKKKANKTT